MIKIKHLFLGMYVVAILLNFSFCEGLGNRDSLTVITLERTECFGHCPVYHLTVFGDGKVVYEGEKYVKVHGIITSHISQSKVKELIAEFKKVDYFSMNDTYTDHRIMDASSSNTSIDLDGNKKSVQHYHGDRSAPPQLSQLEQSIDQMTDSNRWVQCTKDGNPVPCSE